MTDKTAPDSAIKIHRFRDAVALSTTGEGDASPTLYLTPADARALFKQLGQVVRDIEKHAFGESKCPHTGAQEVPAYADSVACQDAAASQKRRF